MGLRSHFLLQAAAGVLFLLYYATSRLNQSMILLGMFPHRCMKFIHVLALKGAPRQRICMVSCAFDGAECQRVEQGDHLHPDFKKQPKVVEVRIIFSYLRVSAILSCWMKQWCHSIRRTLGLGC